MTRASILHHPGEDRLNISLKRASGNPRRARHCRFHPFQSLYLIELFRTRQSCDKASRPSRADQAVPTFHVTSGKTRWDGGAPSCLRMLPA